MDKYLNGSVKKWATGALLLAGVGFVSIGFLNGNGEAKATYTVERRGVVESVRLSGVVEAAGQVDLAFAAGGRVAAIEKTVGESVLAGEVLAKLDNRSEIASRNEALADLEIARIKLQELRGGSGVLDVFVSENSQEQALVSLENAEAALRQEIKEAFVEADDAIKNEVDSLFINATTQPSYGVIVTSGSRYFISDLPTVRVELNAGRRAVTNIFERWAETSVTDTEDLSALAEQVETDLIFIKDFVSAVANSTNTSLNNPSDNTAKTLYDAYRSNVASARTAINSAIDEVQSASQNYQQKQVDLELVNSELDFKIGSTDKETRLQSAEVAKAEARLDLAEANLGDTFITAPFNGEVARVSTELGELVTSGDPAVTLVTRGNYELSMRVPEIDVAKLKLGDQTTITLDAYGEEISWRGELREIELVETEIDGVPVYTATIVIFEPDDRIRVGMNARAYIEVNRVGQAVAVPATYIEKTNNGDFVTVKAGEDGEARQSVELGLRGTDNFYEVRSGLSPGMVVVRAEN